jgi:tellurite resistance protein TerC
MVDNLWLWIGFNAFILLMLLIDLGVFHRDNHVIGIREALGWTALWVVLALIFNAGLWHYMGPEPALKFLTGYLIEKSLSMDNVFVFLLIFTYFKVPAEYQHKVLFWGILGALVFRAIFIFAGVALISKFHWVIYVFGAFLVYTGFKMMMEKDKQIHPKKNPVLRLFGRFIPITKNYYGNRFFIRRSNYVLATPLFVVLIVVETTDIVFAVDSIPAIMAITLDPFIIYSANAFAILGLRALYFALAGVMRIFHYLHYGLSVILIFVGFKMLLEDVVSIPIVLVLGIIVVLIGGSIIASLIWPREEAPDLPTPPTGQQDMPEPTGSEPAPGDPEPGPDKDRPKN